MQPIRPNSPRKPARPGARDVSPGKRPPLRILPTTLWEYPSQHYDAYVNDEGEVVKSRAFASQGPGARGAMQGHKDYTGATPSWVIWQCLMRYTRKGDTVLDPMCGSGTTIDVCQDLERKPIAFDLAPSRPDIRASDARTLPLPNASVDFAFIDPPYSTHVDYSDDPRCIGKLSTAGEDEGEAYYTAMAQVIEQLHRVLRPRRFMALYVSDSFKKKRGGAAGQGRFMPIGFELLGIMSRAGLVPMDIISVVRHNAKLTHGNWRKAAEEGNFFLRGFNYLFIMKKPG